MKVLHVAAGKIYGGLETVLVTIARHREATSDLIQEFAVCFDERLGDELRATGATVHVLGDVQLRKPWRVARVNWRLQRIVRQRGIDALVMHGAWPHVVCASGTLARPIVHWCHGAPMRPHLLDRLAELLRPKLVIVNSRHTESALGSLFAGVSRRVVYNPLDPPPSLTKSRTQLRAELKAVPTDVVIVCASRLERRKGHRLLLDALSSVQQIPNWSLWIVGGAQTPSETDYLHELQAFAHELGISRRVSFLGQRSDVRALLSAADIFCQPNIDPDAFGISYVEALYAGLPVITTAMGGALEIIDQTCGVLVPPEKKALADVLGRMLTDSNARIQLSRGGPMRAQQLCDPTTRMLELATAISTAVASRTPTHATVAGMQG